MHFLDGRYYQFHDEWAWFRLLNGQAVSGMDAIEPASVRGARRRAPLGASRTKTSCRRGWRSPTVGCTRVEFYDSSLAESERYLGAGSLIHVEARANAPRDVGLRGRLHRPGASAASCCVFFNELEQAIPEAARGHLNWFARSPEQLEIGKQLMAHDPRFKGRVMTYADVSIPGETAVYTGGIVAGRLRAFRELSRLGRRGARRHLAARRAARVLAASARPGHRDSADAARAPEPFGQEPANRQRLPRRRARGSGSARLGAQPRAGGAVGGERAACGFHRLTEQQYQAWQALLRSEPPHVPSVSLQGVPYVVKLSRGGAVAAAAPRAADRRQVRRHGAPACAAWAPAPSRTASGALRVDVPDRPLVLTIRAYREHLAPLLPELRALLADENFLKFKKLRFLALEGSKEFVAQVSEQEGSRAGQELRESAGARRRSRRWCGKGGVHTWCATRSLPSGRQGASSTRLVAPALCGLLARARPALSFVEHGRGHRRLQRRGSVRFVDRLFGAAQGRRAP